MVFIKLSYSVLYLIGRDVIGNRVIAGGSKRRQDRRSGRILKIDSWKTTEPWAELLTLNSILFRNSRSVAIWRNIIVCGALNAHIERIREGWSENVCVTEGGRPVRTVIRAAPINGSESEPRQRPWSRLEGVI